MDRHRHGLEHRCFLEGKIVGQTVDDARRNGNKLCKGDRKSTRLNSSHVSISYAVFCLKKKNMINLGHDMIPPTKQPVEHLRRTKTAIHAKNTTLSPLARPSQTSLHFAKANFVFTQLRS